VVELGADHRAVVEEHELGGERVGVAGAGGARETGEQLADPGPVAVADRLDGVAGGRLGAGVDERAAVVARGGEPLRQQREDPDDPVARVFPPGRQDGGDGRLPAVAAPLQVGADELLLGAVGAVERGARDIGLLEDPVDADRADALLIEQLVGRGEEPFAGRGAIVG
jgi:hypothetical protein